MKPDELVQPEPDITASTTPTEWLAPFERSTEARAVLKLDRRLEADAALVTRLMFASYQGRDWELVANRLAAYGLRVITAWIMDGSIALKCQVKGWNGPWDQRCRDREVAQDLATDTVVTALDRFRTEVLIPGTWRPEHGASLSTYFIGQCLQRWANIYRAWRRDIARQTLVVAEAQDEERPQAQRRGSADPAEVAVDRLEREASAWGD